MCFQRSSERIEGKSRPPQSGWKIVPQSRTGCRETPIMCYTCVLVKCNVAYHEWTFWNSDTAVWDTDGMYDILGGHVSACVRAVFVVGHFYIDHVWVGVDRTDVKCRYLSCLTSVYSELGHHIGHDALRLQTSSMCLHLSTFIPVLHSPLTF